MRLLRAAHGGARPLNCGVSRQRLFEWQDFLDVALTGCIVAGWSEMISESTFQYLRSRVARLVCGVVGYLLAILVARNRCLPGDRQLGSASATASGACHAAPDRRGTRCYGGRSDLARSKGVAAKSTIACPPCASSRPNKQLERMVMRPRRARRKCAISLCTCGALDSAARGRSTAALGDPVST